MLQRCFFGIGLSVLVAASTFAQLVPQVEQLPQAVVPSGRGEVEKFFLETPNGAESFAWRDNSDLADKQGNIPAPTGGYSAYARVIIKTDDQKVLDQLMAANAGWTYESLEASPGFFVLHVNTVLEAVATAATLNVTKEVEEAYVDIDSPKSLRVPSDPGYPSQWHHNNTINTIADINVVPVWNMGYTGSSSITVGILEGGFQTTHTDLDGNYNATASQTGGSSTTHGTSTAGLVSAEANNGKCGAGVAYSGKISKLLNGTSTANATAFGYRNDLNYVKSNSWGPADNGLISYMSTSERTALANAVATGRGNKGTIFAWAAGNGGTADRCDYDPYASSRYTVAIGAVTDGDVRSYFNETGSSMFVVCPSNGGSRSIYTTNNNNRCTSTFGGTSAACPIGAGVVALMLQAKPNLGWRDVKHVLVNAARKCDPANSGWSVNGAGHDINYNYGFGAVDALAAVNTALSWVNVPAEQTLTTGVVAVNTTIPDNNSTGVTRQVTAPAFNVESVELILNVTMTYVGDLQIKVTSPSGTQSLLAAARADATDNYVNYIFTSERHWDEDAAGTWSINIADLAAQDVATWTNYEFKVYGTP